MYGDVAELLSKATDQGALDARLTAADKDRVPAFLPGFGAIGGRADGWAYRGDWLSHEVAWQHGSFVSARAAVTALHRRVLAT